MLKDGYSADQIRAAENLIEIINPTRDSAHEQISQFRETLLSDEDEDEDEYANILWVVKDVVDWESGYFVDWKDTESFVQCLTQIAERWGVTLTFGVDDPLDEDFLSQNTVPDLAARAHGELVAQGFMLWSWDTEGDCYGGWIAKSDSAAAVEAISSRLGVQVLPGDRSF